MTETVQLFATCLLDSLSPRTGEAVVTVLRHLGVRTAFPQAQTCCGQPAYNAGLWEQARPLAMHTIKAFEATEGWVVVPSGSCAAMLKHGYPALFAGDPTWEGRARDLAGRVAEFTEFIVDILGETDLGSCSSGKVTYHASCHLLRDLEVDRQPKALLSHVRGIEMVELPGWNECCGFGGVFSAEHPDISSAMLARKLSNLAASGADRLVACDLGCITNINGGLRRSGQKPQAVHIAEVLAEGLR